MSTHLSTDDQSRDQNSKFRKFKLADGRHFENVYVSISSNFDEIWYADVQFDAEIIVTGAILQYSRLLYRSG